MRHTELRDVEGRQVEAGGRIREESSPNIGSNPISLDDFIEEAEEQAHFNDCERRNAEEFLHEQAREIGLDEFCNVVRRFIYPGLKTEINNLDADITNIKLRIDYPTMFSAQRIKAKVLHCGKYHKHKKLVKEKEEHRKQTEAVRERIWKKYVEEKSDDEIRRLDRDARRQRDVETGTKSKFPHLHWRVEN